MLKIGTSEYDDWADAHADVWHPEVYHPLALPTPYDPTTPWDDILKPNKPPTLGDILAADRKRRRTPYDAPTPPIN
jgi:hypothetical protein